MAEHEESWNEIAPHPSARRSRGAAESCTGYSNVSLDELWNGARRWFMLVEHRVLVGDRMRTGWRERQRNLWKGSITFSFF